MSSNAVEVSQPVIEARGITKRYGALTALHGVDLSVRPGEVVGLVGDNGAGKSTLIKILSGALELTDGAVLIDGRQADLRSPLHARRHAADCQPNRSSGQVGAVDTPAVCDGHARVGVVHEHGSAIRGQSRGQEGADRAVPDDEPAFARTKGGRCCHGRCLHPG